MLRVVTTLIVLLLGWLAAGLVTLALLAALFRGARPDEGRSDDEAASTERAAAPAVELVPAPRR